MRRGLVLIIFLAVFLGLVLLVAVRRQPPEIPRDDVHVPVRGDAAACMTCHGFDGAAPRGPNHPFGHECRSCHYEVGEVR